MNAAICKCEPRLAKSKRILETSDSYHITSFHFGSTSVQDFYFHLRFQRCKYVFGFISLNETPNYPFHGYFHSYSSGDFFFFFLYLGFLRTLMRILGHTHPVGMCLWSCPDEFFRETCFHFPRVYDSSVYKVDSLPLRCRRFCAPSHNRLCAFVFPNAVYVLYTNSNRKVNM